MNAALLFTDHKDDIPDDSVTGKYVLRWTESDDVDHPKRPRKGPPKSLGLANERKKALSAAQAAFNKSEGSGVQTPDHASPGTARSMKYGSHDKPDKSPSKKR